MAGTTISTDREAGYADDRNQASAPERRTSAVELFWDLVFVFAVTQVTTLLSRHLTWAGFGRGMLILALVWWAWSAFVWAANAQTDDSRSLRLTLLLAAAFIFISGLALPNAFGAEGLLFAVTYAIVRLLHLALYADASWRGRASWAAIAGFAATVVLGMALLIAGAALHGAARTALWAIAVAIDYAGPAWLTRERLRGLQRVAVAHFAERYGLFVIICLGESIVAIGVGAGAARTSLSVELVGIVALGLLATAAMWWTYFDRFSDLAERRLRAHSDPVLAAADAYSYLHLVIVAGIIIFAVGLRLLVRAPAAAPSEAVRLALCGGVAMYILGHVAFGLRLVGRVGYGKLAIAAALMILYAVGGGLSAWALTAAIAALLVALCGLERIAWLRLRRNAPTDLGLS
ncbi:MAG TPA: low temperature requirement protein A [Solirubrobacteraceae bacterium]|nr:low temperature requirement protein A [Solirubrobacteraceae bacterium]